MAAKTKKQRLQHLLYLQAPGSIRNIRGQLRVLEEKFWDNIEWPNKLADKQQLANIQHNFNELLAQLKFLEERLVAIRKKEFSK